MVNAFYAGAKVTIAGTALIAMNEATEGAVLSAINMVAGAANKMFVTSASSVPVVINTLSTAANDMVVSSINECASQLYQTGAAFVTVFSGMITYFPKFFDAITAVGASVGVSAGVIAVNKFRVMREDDKKLYLRRYLATVLNEIVNVHSQSKKLVKDVQKGVEAANCVNQSRELINEVENLTREELREMVGFVIPYMRSAEYNLSPEDLSFMAGVPVPQFDGKNVAFQIARLAQRKTDIIQNDKHALEEIKNGDMSDSNQNEDDYLRKRPRPNGEETPIESEIKKIDRMLYLLNELNCTFSSDICRIQSQSDATKKSEQTIFRTFSTKGGKKSKRTKKRKPVIRRKQTKRLQKNRRKKQTKK